MLVDPDLTWITLPQDDGDNIDHGGGRLDAHGGVAKGSRTQVLKAQCEVERGLGVTSRLICCSATLPVVRVNRAALLLPIDAPGLSHFREQ